MVRGELKLARVRFGSPNLCSPSRRHQHHARDPNSRMPESGCRPVHVSSQTRSRSWLVTCSFGNIPARWLPPRPRSFSLSGRSDSGWRDARGGVRTRVLCSPPLGCARHVCCEGVRSGEDSRTRHEGRCAADRGQIHRPPSCSGIHGGRRGGDAGEPSWYGRYGPRRRVTRRERRRPNASALPRSAARATAGQRKRVGRAKDLRGRRTHWGFV